MPEKETMQRARRDKRQGKAPTTQAGEFIREEMHHIREGKHGARSSRQAIAIGLSKARRAGVELAPPQRGAATEKTRKGAARDYARGHSHSSQKKSATRSRATLGALKREGHAAASSQALSAQARSASRRRSSTQRSAAARKAVQTKGPGVRSAAARKAAHTRALHAH